MTYMDSNKDSLFYLYETFRLDPGLQTFCSKQGFLDLLLKDNEF